MAKILSTVSCVAVFVGCSKDKSAANNSSTAGAAKTTTAPAKKPPAKKPPAPSQPEKKPVTDPNAALTWKMTLSHDGATLHIDYQVENKTQEPLHVADKLVVPKGNKQWARTDSITVMNDGMSNQPGAVVFALAAISSDRPSATLYTPTFRAIEPGARLDASVETPYPLKAWNPVGGANAIDKAAKSGRFVLDYFVGEPPSWKTLASADAQALKIPDGNIATLGLLRGDSKPLPTP